MTRHKNVSRVFKFILILVGTSGIMMQTGVFSGNVNIYMFRMFTILSNCVCVCYLIAAFVCQLTGRHQGAFLSQLRGMCLLSISLTGIIAAVLLPGMVNFTSMMGVSMFLLHVIMPLGFILNWIFFEPKGIWKRNAPVMWLIAPYVYLAYILISAQFMTGDMRYPYPFLDVETLGVGKFVFFVLGLTAAFLLLGYLYYRIDKKLAEKTEK